MSEAREAKMKKIKLTNGEYTILDESDYLKYRDFVWHCSLGYAVMKIKKNGIVTSARMHRLIMDAPNGMDVDHINHNILDNRRCNLRVVTHHQNMMNIKKNKKHSSKYKGVYFDKKRSKFVAQICVKYKNKFIGYFEKEDEAALAYNESAKKHFGDFSRLNEVCE